MATIVSISKPKLSVNFIDGNYTNLKKRKITTDTCRKFNYRVGTHNGKQVHIANYYNKDLELEAQHIRYPNKDFIWIGDIKNVLLFGQNLWRDGGKLLVITEGELDCLSISQYVFQNRY